MIACTQEKRILHFFKIFSKSKGNNFNKLYTQRKKEKNFKIIQMQFICEVMEQ
jgi:hypothetical protein